MAAAALVDASPLIATADRRDLRHGAAVRFFGDFAGVLVTTWPVVTEVCHLVPRRSAIQFMRSVARGGIEIRDVPRDALGHLAELMEKYADLPMDLADASLMWLANEIGVRDVVTFNERDFAVYRLAGGKRFNNLIAARRG